MSGIISQFKFFVYSQNIQKFFWVLKDHFRLKSCLVIDLTGLSCALFFFINTHMLKFGLAKQKNIIFVQNDKMKFFSILTPFFQKNKEQYIRLLR